MSLCFSTYVFTYVFQTADLLSGCSPYIPPHPYTPTHTHTYTHSLPSSFLTTYNRLPRQSVQTKTPDIPDFTFVLQYILTSIERNISNFFFISYISDPFWTLYENNFKFCSEFLQILFFIPLFEPAALQIISTQRFKNRDTTVSKDEHCTNYTTGENFSSNNLINNANIDHVLTSLNLIGLDEDQYQHTDRLMRRWLEKTDHTIIKYPWRLRPFWLMLCTSNISVDEE